MNHMTVVPENYDSDSETEIGDAHARQKATIYVPTDVPTRRRDAIMARLADVYGGFTVSEARGGWVNPNGHLETERVTKVEAIRMDSDTPKASVIAQSCANWLQDHTSEDVVLWETEQVKAGME